MLKRSIKLIIFTFLISLTINLNVFAEEDIYSELNSGDIVIGNTIFRETWVSSSRAAKAGALYTQNTGSTDVTTYKYISVGSVKLWYVYDLTLDDYRVMNSDEVIDLESNLKIYYNNNEPLMHTYSENVRVYDFFWEFLGEDEYLVLDNIYSDEVTIDIDNESITCPYGHEFTFDAVYDDGNTETFVGYCNIDGTFNYEYELYANVSELEINSIGVSDTLFGNEMANQSKFMTLEYQYDTEVEKYDVFLGFLGDLELINWPDSIIAKKWIGIDIAYDKENVSYFNEIYTNSFVEYRVTEIDNNTVQLWINAEDLFNVEYVTFIILDQDGNREDINIYTKQYSEENSLVFDAEEFVFINHFFKNNLDYADELYSVGTAYNIEDYNYGDLYYAEGDEENRIYIAEDVQDNGPLIFADANGLKLIRKAPDWQIEEFVAYVEGTGENGLIVSYADTSTFLNLDSEKFSTLFSSEVVEIDYFFNRNLTLEEQEKLEYLETLENVVLNDMSDYFYGYYE